MRPAKIQRSYPPEVQEVLPLPEFPPAASFPSTRFQGSKVKLVDWIWENIGNLPFNTALDLFGGTGCVAYRFKQAGKSVTYNDALRFNSLIGMALIQNSTVKLSSDDVEWILTKQPGLQYPTFIQETFRDIYYTDDENQWLDVVLTNIRRMQSPHKRAIAFFALFQACIIKRPFNLFHRKNLYIRTQDVERSFGNKTTWDKPFDHWFRHFVSEANLAVFDNGQKSQSLKCNPEKVTGKFDLVYIDTPYISNKGVGVDYLQFYHFLEGMTDYKNWPRKIDYSKKHRPLEIKKSCWVDPKMIHGAFDRLFSKYKDSILVVSYRDNGIPSEDELLNLLRKYKTDVMEVKKKNYKYVLSTYSSSELLFVAK